MAKCAGGVMGVVFSALAISQAQAAPPSIVQIDGGFDTDVFSISADGSAVAGTTRLTSGGPVYAFRWTAGHGPSLLSSPSGLVPGRVRGVSGDGSTFVGGEGGGGQAFRWRAPDQLLRLPFLPTSFPSPRSEALGASFDGSVIVGESGSTTSNTQRAFRWTQAGGAQPLGALPGGLPLNNTAAGVSSDGTVIAGHALDGAGFKRAARWTEATGFVALPLLTGDLGDAFALGISPDGGAIFGSAATTRGNREGFRWTATTGTVPLGDLAAANFRTFPRAASADGSIIVGLSDNKAFIWDEAHGMRSLATVLATEHGVDLTGWTLSAANAISYDGLTIAGTGRAPDGDTSGWIVTIPAPGASVVLALASMPVVRRRRTER